MNKHVAPVGRHLIKSHLSTFFNFHETALWGDLGWRLRQCYDTLPLPGNHQQDLRWVGKRFNDFTALSSTHHLKFSVIQPNKKINPLESLGTSQSVTVYQLNFQAWRAKTLGPGDQSLGVSARPAWWHPGWLGQCLGGWRVWSAPLRWRFGCSETLAMWGDYTKPYEIAHGSVNHGISATVFWEPTELPGVFQKHT